MCLLMWWFVSNSVIKTTRKKEEERQLKESEKQRVNCRSPLIITVLPHVCLKDNTTTTDYNFRFSDCKEYHRY